MADEYQYDEKEKFEGKKVKCWSLPMKWTNRKRGLIGGPSSRREMR
jgi:hypothetical protein